MADKINIRKLFLGQVGDETSPTSPVINGINVSDKNINAATTPAEALIQSMVGARQDFNPVSPEDYKKEFKRNQIDLTKISNEEELNKKRAANQSFLKQFGNFLEQAIIGEVVLGSVMGLTNAYDIAKNALIEMKAAIGDEEEPLNDFTSEASQRLEELKEKNRERFAIHQENPGKAFDVGDSGWWFNGLVNVATTASLLIPTSIITKAPSVLINGAKMLKLTKAANKATKVANDVFGASKLSKSIMSAGHKIGLVSRPATRAKQLDFIAKTGTNAFVMRTLENWQEAREVYKSTYDDALTKVNDLFTVDEDETKEAQKRIDREKFIERNPQFNGKSNEEIAKWIADASANETFINDYAMLLMDIPQFAGINALWRGLANKTKTARLSIANQNAAKNLSKGIVQGTSVNTTSKLPELTSAGKEIIEGTSEKLIKNNWINRIKETAKNPFNVFNKLELSEGVEEAYQGIMTEKGKEFADLIFDPSTPKRALESYLQDPDIQEQAVWGILGGMGFKALGTGLGNIERRVTDKYNKSKMSEIDFAKSKLTDEKLRELEIAGRYDTIQKLNTDLELINQGKNPFKRDKTGKDYEILNDEEKDAAKAAVTNNFLTKLTLDAVDAGNFDLLVDFVQTPEFKKVLTDLGVYDDMSTKLNDSFIETMKSVREIYQNNLHTALEYAKGSSPWVANNLARNITRHELTLEDLRTKSNDIHSKMDIDPNYYNASELEYYQNVLNEIEQRKNDIVDAFNKKQISPEAREQYLEDLREELNVVSDASFVHRTLDDGGEAVKIDVTERINQIREQLNRTKENNPELYKRTVENTPDRAQLDLMQQNINLNYQIAKEEQAIPKTNNQWKKAFNELERFTDQEVKARFTKAVDKIKEFIKESDSVAKAQEDLYNGNVNEDLKEALDLVKIGYTSTADLWLDIQLESMLVDNDRQQTRKNDNKVIVNGIEITDPAEISRIKNENINAAKEQDVPPTGEISQVPPAPVEVPPEIPQIAPESIPVPQQDEVLPINVETPEPPVDIPPPEEEIPIRDIDIPKIDERTRILEQVLSYIYRNNKGDIRTNLEDIIINRDLNRDSFQNIVNELKNNILNNYTNLNENDKIEIVKSAIHNWLSDKILAMQYANRDTSNEIAVINQLSGSGTLLSQFSVINILPVEERINTLTKALDSYIKYRNKPNQKQYTIDVVDLFSAIIEQNPKVRALNLLSIFRALTPYINKGINLTGVKYKFNKKSKEIVKEGFEDFIKNDLFQQRFAKRYQAKGFRMEESEFGGKALADIISGKINNPFIKVKYYKNTLSIYYTNKNGKEIEIGYIPTVEQYIDKDGNITTKNKNSTGALYVFKPDAFGEVTSNFDELYYNLDTAVKLDFEGNLAPYEKLVELLQKSDEEITDEDYYTLYSIPDIAKLIDDGKEESRNEETGLFEKTKGGLVEKFDLELNRNNKLMPVRKPRAEVAKHFIWSVKSALLDSKGELKFTNIIEKFIAHKEYIYANNLQVLELQDKLNKGEIVELNVVPVRDNILNNTKESHLINDVISAEEYQTYPLFYIDELGKGITEDGQQFESNIAFSDRTGMIVQKGNTPLIALLEAASLKESKSELINDVKEEIKDIIKKYLNKEKGYTFEEVANKLTNLLSGNDNNSKLFTGISISQSDGILNIKQYKDIRTTEGYASRNESIFTINKYHSNEARIRATRNGEKIIEDPWIKLGETITKSDVGFKSYNEKLAEQIAQSVVNNLKFNQSDIGFSSKTINEQSSPYFYKDGSKIVVNIAGNKRVYDNYAHFVYSNNTVKTTATKVNGSFYSYNEYARRAYGIPLEIKRKIDKTNLNNVDTRTIVDIVNDVEQSESKLIDSKTVLRSVGFTNDTIDLALGVNGDFAIIPGSVALMSEKQLEEHKEVYGVYNSNTKSIHLNQDKLREATPGEDLKSNVIRTLLHENIHKLLTESEESPLKRQQAVNEIIETFALFKNLIEQEKESNEIAKIISESKLYKNFLSKYKVKNGKLYIGNKKASAEEIDFFVQEWLAESLTQSAIIQFNNSHEGIVDADLSKIESKPKTIFQRIIDAILKLYSLVAKTFKSSDSKLKNNTILAKQYLVLAGEIQTTLFDDISEVSEEIIEEQEQEEVIEDDAVSPVEEESVKIDQSESEEIIDYEDELKRLEELDEDYDDFEIDDTEFFSNYESIDFEAQDENEAMVQAVKVNTNVNSNRMLRSNNMNGFMDNFKDSEKPLIANLLSENKINYVCQ